MTVKQIIPTHYEFETGDSKPTGVKLPVTTLRDTLTNAMWITYDGGANWIIADKRVRIVKEDGSFADVGYEFTINGVNFNGYANIKMLTLDADAEDDDPKPFNFEGSPYQVGATKIFIVFQALIKLQQTDVIGRIGEADSSGGAISKEVLKLSQGTILPFMVDCWGVFTSGKYITAETDSSSDVYQLQSGSVLYGVEVDA